MKKMGIVLLSAALSAAWLAPVATLAEKGDRVIVLAQATGADEADSQPRESSRSGNTGARVTHADLAKILVNLLGLSRFVPVGASAQQHFAVLMDHRINLPGGWVTDATVTKGDLAVAIVKSMKAMGEIVEIDTDNSRAAIGWLRDNGVPIDSIGASVASLRPLADPSAPGVFNPDTDPISRRELYSPVDEAESGTDAARSGRGPEEALYEPTPEEVVAIIETVTRPSRPTTPPTPFKP